MNNLPIMPIRAKYADETTKGVNIDEAIESAAGDIDAVEDRIETLENKTQNISYNEGDNTVEVDGGLDVEGHVSAGDITGNSIIENMEGYSARILEATNLTINNVYQGIVKNGNKLTLVSAIKLTRTDTVSLDIGVAEFTIPASIGSKLYPVELGSYVDGLSFSSPQAMSSLRVGVQQYSVIEKQSNTKLLVYLLGASNINNLVQGTEYYIRVEATFLLSENLAS